MKMTEGRQQSAACCWRAQKTPPAEHAASVSGAAAFPATTPSSPGGRERRTLDVSGCSSPPLSAGTIRDPLWMPETTDSMDPTYTTQVSDSTGSSHSHLKMFEACNHLFLPSGTLPDARTDLASWVSVPVIPILLRGFLSSPHQTLASNTWILLTKPGPKIQRSRGEKLKYTDEKLYYIFPYT